MREWDEFETRLVRVWQRLLARTVVIIKGPEPAEPVVQFMLEFERPGWHPNPGGNLMFQATIDENVTDPARSQIAEVGFNPPEDDGQGGVMPFWYRDLIWPMHTNDLRSTARAFTLALTQAGVTSPMQLVYDAWRYPDPDPQPRWDDTAEDLVVVPDLGDEYLRIPELGLTYDQFSPRYDQP